VNFDVAGHQTEGYLINTDVFEGPLDLLLQLIERAELDITRLALAEVTDQYLDYMKELQDRNASEVSAFLVIATRLLQIKSAALLPRPPADAIAPEEDPGEALAQQLIIYKRFKELSRVLDQRENEGLRTYLRVAPPPRVEGRVDLTNISLDDLRQAAYQIFCNQPHMSSLNSVVNIPRITIREKIHWILDAMRQKTLSTFQAILMGNHSRIDVVVTFLAMLELIKVNVLQVQQVDQFGEIEIQPVGEWNENDEAALEFGE
jgi:segregation and condensation protein A